MEVKSQLLNLKPYQPGKPIDEVKKEYGLDHIVKLASNENPYGSSAKVKQAVEREISQLALYPDGYSAELREKLSSMVGVDQDQLIFGNGSDEIVQIICRALLDQNSNTVMATPTFPQYRHNAIIENAEIREVPLKAGEHDLDAMLEAIDDYTKVVWVCSPNNPTGNYVNKSSMEAFLKKVPPSVLVVLDEAYAEYVTAEDYPDSVPYLQTYENVMILRTFSKAYGLAALRIGYGIGCRKLVQMIEPAREPFNTSRIAQAAALAALDDQEFIQTCRERNRAGLKQYYAFCEENNLSYYPSEGNFILIDFNQDANSLFQQLLERGYIVRSGAALGFPTSLRITVGSEGQNREIIELLKTLL
ncbi:histidinol-phosphate transaminase [Bacillus sp. FJAT-42376]|uniref:histidinol-phosphate transaminase n=1 Tax=Bacillus sp. FJAT-42376 TaxID=2014076 RepID=UPI000F514145|nr:histidinol-phosphate transaminase [Bacillus sp. FJAT-42376]AZB43327.1 histidinol-phosphate transaminase [Bacillus sp. FJAT-42376]